VARGPLKVIDTQYIATGRAKLIFKHYPLAIHASARNAAAAAICAGGEDRFWPMHDLLFENQARLADADLDGHAQALGLGLDRFRSCRDQDATKAIIDADVELGKNLGVPGTPTFYIGVVQPDGGLQVTDVLMGARPLPDFTKVLDRLLADRR
jgi:protein-disulfide isomerase